MSGCPPRHRDLAKWLAATSRSRVRNDVEVPSHSTPVPLASNGSPSTGSQPRLTSVSPRSWLSCQGDVRSSQASHPGLGKSVVELPPSLFRAQNSAERGTVVPLGNAAPRLFQDEVYLKFAAKGPGATRCAQCSTWSLGICNQEFPSLATTNSRCASSRAQRFQVVGVETAQATKGLCKASGYLRALRHPWCRNNHSQILRSKL